MTDPIQQLQEALADRYRLEHSLGDGGMALVYLAHDLRHDRKVAIKVLKPGLSAILGSERFLQESRIAAQLDHPHILTLIDSGDAGGVLYYVIPYVRGESLRAKLDREKRLGIGAALALAAQIASALDYAHRRGVIHRDIKPENILLHEGEAVVADFGIALAAPAGGGGRLTETGMMLGTPAYMSPEQMTGGEVGPASDVYAVGALLYEMLTGEAPYTGPTPQSIMAKRLTGAVPSARRGRPEVPAAVDQAIRRALATDPGDRYETVSGFVDACVRATAGGARRRPYLLLGIISLLLVASAAAIPIWFSLQRERSRTSLVQAEQLERQGKYAEAYDLAAVARRRIPDDTTLARLLPLVADRLTVMTEPAGARVTVQRFAPDSAGLSPPPVEAGTTPLQNLEVPRGDYRVVVEKAGFAPLERIASSAYLRSEMIFRRDSVIHFELALPPAGRSPAGMVRVPGGSQQLTSPDAPVNTTDDVGDFDIDRFEVTNEDYKEFIASGGYANGGLWPGPFRDESRAIGSAAALERMIDRTHLPGPRSWTSQEFPTGMARHPVTDVTWYEAAAFCASKGKRLPSIFQWERAARSEDTPHDVQAMLPWGVAAPRTPATFRANFSGTGTTPVGAYPFGISPYGAYDMAGNVKEWTATPVGNGYLATGGSYEDPLYLFGEYSVLGGLSSGRAVGFRCARSVAAADAAKPLPIERRTPVYHPIGEAEFRSLLSLYRYDRRPLDARVLERIETPDWTREKIQYAGEPGDSVIGYLFLPRQTVPPYQIIHYVGSLAAFVAEPTPEEAIQVLGPHIKAGRAVWVAVLKGMIGREWEPGHREPEPNSVQFRDEMVFRSGELRRGLDYLETRAEIDKTRIAYFGFSWGAGSRLVYAATDDRYRAVVLVGGGLDERMQPTLPEASNINFAPYIKPPKLLLNGRNDEENRWLSRGLPLWNLLRAPKKLVLVDGASHSPPPEDRVPVVNAWLDQTLGPVKRTAGVR
ncbi:MAG: SUMF1/EgtB/PvdO family nonheme iron enzyme [Gemmatimonadota bacterium]